MAVEASAWQEERVAGRVWTVRLDPDGRPSAGAVRLSCSRPACADQRLAGGAAAGRRAAIGHIKEHLARIREGGGPRGDAWCACRAASCAWHTPDPTAGPRTGAQLATAAVRCGGSVVLTVYADRAGRLWRIAEMCARCAAATADCRVLDTAPPPARTTPAGMHQAAEQPDAEQERAGGAPGQGVAAVFSDRAPSPASASPSAAATPPPVPRARPATPGGAPRRAKRWGKIAQRIVPQDLEPEVLRLELVELGDAFRAYQQRTEPDLAILSELHERKARAFALWADVSGDGSLRHEAKRAETAAQTTREMHANRGGQPLGGTAGDGPVVERLLTRTQAAHARTVLDYVAAHASHSEAEVRLAVLMLTLRAAKAGTGNVTGQDLTGWLQDDAEQVIQRLVAADWLRLPGTVAELMASRSENPTAVTVPTLLPGQPRPFAFGKTTRARISGWAQKVVGDRKIRKKKATSATRLLALYTAAHTRPAGHLGRAEDDGLHLDPAAAFCTLPPDQIAEHAALLIAADWLTEAGTAEGRLRGRLTERILPLGGLL
ncbi:hypothetical protein [Streptomyces telluris]|uniref:Uncharacterized protein n=1 Tax=Streptomyces telluris TaxID=2720021 RepID=A0A9X2LID9_9ACTN|nr:hypothetical protein [Streptomyces telluris]MCQ8772086.1 hypothetical protein [Streptomyces telluris]NJP78538.1 hypothetical protein [Streptomyces telluris]